MDGLLPQPGLVAVVVIINALFAGSELAPVSLREGRLQRLQSRGRSGAVLACLARQPNRFRAAIQIGITLGRIHGVGMRRGVLIPVPQADGFVIATHSASERIVMGTGQASVRRPAEAKR